MHRLSFLKYTSLTLVLLFVYSISFSQEQIEKLWYNQEKTAKIQVYKAKNGKYYGKIVWLKEPLKDGKPKVDDKNPDAAKRDVPLIDLLVLKGFDYEGDNLFEDGTIYDPKNGKTYSCKMTLNGDVLNVRGYVGISLLGRTAVWTAAD